MFEGHRTVEDLLNATSSAPRFGLNARELILQAAQRIAAQEDDNKGGDEDGKQPGGQKASKQLLLFLYRKAPELLQGLPRDEKPLVPFKAIQRSKVPRITRQAVLDRLTGQHLAMALHAAGASICTEQLLQRAELRSAALKAAVEQEEAVYQRGRAAKSVYLNYAARENAADYLEAKAPENSLPEGCTAPDEPTDTAEERSEGGAGDGDVPAEGEDPAAEQTRETPSSAEGEGRRKRKKVAPAALVEDDIDWGSGGPVDPPSPTAGPGGGQSAVPTAAGQGEGPEKSNKQARKATSQSAKTTALELPAGRLQPLSGEGPRKGAAGERSTGGAASSDVGGGFGPAMETFEEEGQPSAEGLMDYSPTRHGGESPPRREPAGSAARDPPEGVAVVGNPKVAAAVATFLRAHLDPLFQAKVIDKPTFKTAMQKTVEKVMACHKGASDARFLIKDGPKITKLLMQYVERLTT